MFPGLCDVRVISILIVPKTSYRSQNSKNLMENKKPALRFSEGGLYENSSKS